MIDVLFTYALLSGIYLRFVSMHPNGCKMVKIDKKIVAWIGKLSIIDTKQPYLHPIGCIYNIYFTTFFYNVNRKYTQIGVKNQKLHPHILYLYLFRHIIWI